MNTKVKNQSGGVNIRSEKLYTQSEVTELLNNQKNNSASKTKEAEANIETEKITLDKIEEDNDNKRTVEDLVRKSNTILISISSHALPFDIFPDVINVEESRVTIIKRHLYSSDVYSLDIKDISNILINTSFIFSQLIIISKTFEANEIRMKNLRTKEAIYVRRIIEGLRIFENKKIDTSGYTSKELIAKLEELSTVATET